MDKPQYYIISFTAWYGVENEYLIRHQKCPLMALSEDISGIDLMMCVSNLIWQTYGIRVNAIDIENVWKVPELVKQ